MGSYSGIFRRVVFALIVLTGRTRPFTAVWDCGLLKHVSNCIN